MLNALLLCMGMLVGGGIVWVLLRPQMVAVAGVSAQRDAARTAQGHAERALAVAEAMLVQERASAQEQLRLVRQGDAQLREAFAALSREALSENSKQLVELAKAELGQHHVTAREELEKRQRAVEQIAKPIGESLAKVDGKLEALERSRAQTQGALAETLRGVAEGQERLRAETARLRTAMRSPVARGRWGELQLRRVCELAGMVEHCDFLTQTTVDGEDGRLRPDLVVKLPAGKDVVVDSKAPLEAYLNAHQATDEATRSAELAAFGRHIRNHVAQLSAKRYWSQFESAPEFVVLFLPSEALFSAALEQCPDLIEHGVAQSVLIAAPTTLIALLRAVAYGWRQELVAESAREVAAMGRELYERLAVLGAHFDKVGRSLDTSVRAYNEAVGSLEGRVLVTARRFHGHGAAAEGRELSTPRHVPTTVRALQAPELLDGESAAAVLPPERIDAHAA
jgi:DNA recombination protein RmuC